MQRFPISLFHCCNLLLRHQFECQYSKVKKQQQSGNYLTLLTHSTLIPLTPATLESTAVTAVSQFFPPSLSISSASGVQFSIVSFQSHPKSRMFCMSRPSTNESKVTPQVLSPTSRHKDFIHGTNY
ncbi:hypothetical protein CDAR_318201 [Caerostris darwini]|uniref:Uncharacterized protein n=1 Tax=Caerostris darwini TaxID=1538125 RepID=A0AAV4TAH5_9ARAC|nr:hypothetical protein CDAR_318201 [Caerostris darwini]